MIDYENAKALVLDWLSYKSEDLGIQIEIDEDNSVEEEWGWIIFWKVDATATPESMQSQTRCKPYLVDRVTGRVRQVSTAGLKASVFGLLRERES